MPSARLIQTIGRIPLVGSLLRWWARRYPEDSIVTIQHGEAAGFSWRRHHRYVNGYWIGHYELPLQSVLKRELRAGQTFWDVGANAGFFTLVAARLVGPTGKCIAFDPAPANVESIREQIELNSLAQCQAVQEAVGQAVGQSTFSFAKVGAAMSMGHLGQGASGEEQIVVQVTTIAAAAERFGSPDMIKMDIEGAEIFALPGAAGVLSTQKPTWLIELHSIEANVTVSRILREAGYDLFDLNDQPVRGDAMPNHIVARHPGR